MKAEAVMRRLTMTSALAGLACLAAAGPVQATNLGKSHGYTYIQEKATVPAGTGASASPPPPTCPHDGVLMGGGAAIAGEPAATYLSSLDPAEGGGLLFASGWHNSLEASSLKAWGVCTQDTNKMLFAFDEAPIPAGPVNGSISVSCSDGFIVGGGGSLDDDPSDSWLGSTYPASTPDVHHNAWGVKAFHRNGTSPAMISVHAICMKGSEPVYKTESKQSSHQLIDVEGSCPTGFAVVGGGGYTDALAGQAHLISSKPTDDGDHGKVPDDGWSVEWANTSGNDVHYKMFAICR
jgi:hypothetical protein